MLYLLDASVLITAHNLYYPIDRVPEFWSWLVHMGREGRVKIPLEFYEEIKDGRDDDELVVWIKSAEVKDALLLDDEADVALVSRVINEGYAPDLDDAEVETIGRDPFLVAYALARFGECCVVTSEASKPGKRRANRRIPDICKTFEVRCIDSFRFTRELDFSTSWHTRQSSATAPACAVTDDDVDDLVS